MMHLNCGVARVALQSCLPYQHISQSLFCGNMLCYHYWTYLDLQIHNYSTSLMFLHVQSWLRLCLCLIFRSNQTKVNAMTSLENRVVYSNYELCWGTLN